MPDESHAAMKARLFAALDSELGTHMEIMAEVIDAGERGDWNRVTALAPALMAARDRADAALAAYLNHCTGIRED